MCIFPKASAIPGPPRTSEQLVAQQASIKAAQGADALQRVTNKQGDPIESDEDFKKRKIKLFGIAFNSASGGGPSDPNAGFGDHSGHDHASRDA